MKITNFVNAETYASLMFFRCGMFFYSIINKADKDLYTFPVPVEDLGNATITPYEKSVTLMRWIRKAIADGTMIKYNESQEPYMR